MSLNPHISQELASERQRGMLAEAEQRRLVRQVRAAAEAVERRRQPQQRLRRAVRVVLLMAPEG